MTDLSILSELLNLQSGVLSRRQAIAAGMGAHDIRRQLRRRDWVVVHPGVYVDHTGELTWLQRAWAAVLFAWPAALCDGSALRAEEGPGKRKNQIIHVAVSLDRRIQDQPGVRIHRLKHLSARALWNRCPPCLRYEEAALDVAAGSASDFEALGLLAQACQSRRTTASRMLTALADRSRSPRRQWLSAVLTDLSDGACSVLEHGYLNLVERAHGLPDAQRQRRVEATLGVTYRDVEYDDLVIELDGRLFHDSADQRDRDMDRDLDAAVANSATVRLSYGQVFDRPCSTAARLGALLQNRGWSGSPHACGPDCPIGGG